MIIDRFLGIDYRASGAERANFLQDALNVSCDSGGALVRRPALQFLRSVPSTTKGLFAVGDQFCVAAPTGVDTSALLPDLHAFKVSGGGTMAEIRGLVCNAIGRPALLVENSIGGAEYHLCEQIDSNPVGTTLVTLPFTPRLAGIAKVGSRAWLLDDGAFYRRANWSAIDDPTVDTSLRVWDEAADPDNQALRGGFLDLGQHTSGGGKPSALAEYNGRIAACFPYAIQIWRVGSDETDRYLEGVITGPGVVRAEAIASVGEDAFFLTPDLSVRSLQQSTLTQGAKASSPGSAIEDMIRRGIRINAATTIGIYDTNTKPICFYSRSRSQFYLILGQHVLCLGLSPGEAARGWTRWKFPVGIDAIAEIGTIVQVRCGDIIYRLVDDQDGGDEVTDGNYTPIEVLVETMPAIMGANGKVIQRIATRSTQDLRLQIVRDGRPARQNDGGLGAGVGSIMTMRGRSPTPSSCLVGWFARTAAVRMQTLAARADWRLESLQMDMRDTGEHGADTP